MGGVRLDIVLKKVAFSMGGFQAEILSFGLGPHFFLSWPHMSYFKILRQINSYLLFGENTVFFYFYII